MACGPKCMAFMMLMSIWGIIFLSILGGLYYNQSVGLFEDLPDEDKKACNVADWDCRKKEFVKLYQQNAYNCWVAAGGNASAHAAHLSMSAMQVPGLHQLASFAHRMYDVLVGGVWVPSAIASHFKNTDQAPFSYTKPNLKFQSQKSEEKKKENEQQEEPRTEEATMEQKASPPLLITERGMAQPVHLQYNSPMPIYSKEAAEEQYQQQIGEGTSPIPLPLGDKHFDPEKSATLKFIKEGNEGHFGEHFFEQIANAEAPRVFHKEEPEWARYARAKSERARSRTPADPSQHQTPATTPTQTRQHERPRADSPHEFIEKTRTYTNTVQPRWGPAYYQTQSHSLRRGHSEPREIHPGYECGGLDYTKGLHFPPASNEYYEVRSRRAQHDQHRPRSGYELGGVSYARGYVSPGPYHGHGPDPPRLRPKYSADPRSPCNSYYAPNVDEVDANLLVGDTISNQKISHEVRHVNQNEFGTSFAPPTGFKRDHMYVKRSPAPPEPVTYSLSANKARYASANGLSSTQHQQRSHQEKVWQDYQQQNASGGKESYNQYPPLAPHYVFTTEPNWSRTVQQRRNAWERMAYDTDARVSLPASAKVPAPQPPAWHNKAARTHNVWQQAADTMSQGVTQSYIQQPQSTFETSQTSYHQSGAVPYQSQYQDEQRHSQYSSSGQEHQQSQQQQGYSSSQHTETHTTSHSVPVQQTRSAVNGGSNAELLLNTGYNANQIEYLRDHLDKYRAGPAYQAPNGQNYEQMKEASYSKSYSSSSQQQNVSQSAAPIALPAPAQNYSYSTETRTSSQTAAPASTGYQQQQQQSSYSHHSSHTNETNARAVPVVPEKSNFEESKRVYMEERRTATSTPTPRVTFKDMHLREPFPLNGMHSMSMPSLQHSEEMERFHKLFSSENARTIPVQETHRESEAKHFEKRHTSKEETRTTTIPVRPVQSAYQESSYHRSESSKQESSRAIPIQSASNAQESHAKTYISNTQAVPLAVQPTQNYSTSSYTETHSNQPPMVMHSPGGSYKSYQSSHYSKQEKTTSTTTSNQPAAAVTQTTNLPITKTTSYNYQQQSVPTAPAPVQMSQSSFTSHSEKSTTGGAPIALPAPAARSNYQASMSSHREESHREETSRPVSQLSQYSEQKHYKRNMEEKTETRTIPAATNAFHSDSSRNYSSQDVFNKKEEMNETLPPGSISNTHANTQGGYRDQQGHDVSYKRETQTAVDPGKEYALLKEEEKRVVETDLEPGVISRHVTTKYYKKKTVTDTTTTTTPQ
ncbi:hypothetical protein Q1695_004771 [Nippostrongylus brasiliensis]|nr:hypothetical protein Q1695_004771 [Nippostrongylus brasiliensis]